MKNIDETITQIKSPSVVDKAITKINSPSVEELEREKGEFDIQQREAELNKLKQDIQHLKQNQEENRVYRQSLVEFAKKLTIWYLIFVGLIFIVMKYFFKE